MPPILLHWPMMSEEDVGDMIVDIESSCQYYIRFCAVQQMAAEGKSDNTASDMEMCMKKRYGIEFLKFYPLTLTGSY